MIDLRPDRRILLCNAFSTTSGWINRIAVPLSVYGMTGSAVDTSIAFAVAHLPAVTIGLVAGTIVDKYPASALIKTTALSSGICILGIAALLAEWGVVPAIYLLLFINSSLSAIQLPAFQVLITESSPKHRLQSLNADLGMIDQLNSVLAPLAAGALLTMVRPSLVFVLSGLCYVAAAAAISDVRSPNVAKNRDVTSLQGIKDGFRTIAGDSQLFATTLLFLWSNFATTLVQSMSVPILSNRFGGGSYTVGLFFTTVGLFGIAGHAVAKAIPARHHSAWLIVKLTTASALLTALLTIPLPFAAFTTLWGASVLLGCINITMFLTYRQRAVPAALMGRSVAASRVVTYLPIPLAALFAGVVFERWGGGVLLWIAAGARLSGIVAAILVLCQVNLARRV